jgi:ubiquinone/menaquinone biosynthesis C-methylase UbiE
VIQVYNGFATTDRCRDRIGAYEIPDDWWSRKFEYPWAAQYISPTDVVLDAGCGVTHPFKYYLAETCRKVYGVDIDSRLTDDTDPTYGNLELIQADLTAIPLRAETVDKIICISVIEHMPPKTMDTVLLEFTRLLKPKGQAIVTVDVPTISPREWRKCIEASPLSAGATNWDVPENVLVEPATLTYQERMVFCTVLNKG